MFFSEKTLTPEERKFIFDCILMYSNFVMESEHSNSWKDLLLEFPAGNFIDPEEHVIFLLILYEALTIREIQTGILYNPSMILDDLARWIVLNYKDMGFSLEIERSIGNIWKSILDHRVIAVYRYPPTEIPAWFWDEVRNLEGLIDSYDRAIVQNDK